MHGCNLIQFLPNLSNEEQTTKNPTRQCILSFFMNDAGIPRMTMVVGSNTYTRQQQQQQQQQQHQKYLRNEIFGLLSSQKNVVVTFLVLQHTICYILSGMKESPWHMVDVLRPRLFSRFMFLDRKVIKRRQESLIPLTFQEQLSFFFCLKRTKRGWNSFRIVG